jgi:outer membrane biosynthesis protein TonB
VYSLAHVLSPQFGRTWQEAVAIVQAFAEATAGLDVLPLPADVSLTDDGAIVLGFAGESGEGPVSSLAGLLGALLEGLEAPDALFALAADNAKPQPAHATVASFMRALAFYERPGREHDLRAVASRLRAERLPELDTDKEIERLREKVTAVAAAADAPVKAKDGETKSRIAYGRFLAAAAVGVVLVVALVGAAWGAYVLYQVATAPVVVDAQEARVEPLPEPPAEKTAESSTSSAAVGGRPTSASPGAGPRRAIPAGPEASVSDTALADVLLPISPGRAPDAFIDRAAVAGMQVEQAWEDDGGGAVYSAAHTDVHPPVLVRRQLPSGIPLGSDTGYFELLVDQYGLVEQVRLISPATRYHERMLVSAAKAWQFRPARLNGQAVRYRTRIPITIAGERR